MRKAQDLMHLGNYSAARKIYQDLSHSDPGNHRFHYQLALCALADRDYQAARQELETCIRLNPRHIEALIELGDLLFKLGDDDKALGCLQRCVELDPDHSRAHTYLARLYEHMGDFPRAIAHYTRALERSSANESPRHDLALAHIQNGDLLEGYLMLQELLDEADLGVLWSQLNRTEQSVPGLHLSGAEDYIRLLREEMEQIELLYYERFGFSIHYTRSILDALDRYLSLSESEIAHIRNEIRVLNHLGLGFSGDTRRFELQSLNGQFSGFELGCYLYAAEQLTRSESLLPENYEAAFSQALAFFQDHS